MTIADKIRGMTDDELAYFLADNEKFLACQFCGYSRKTGAGDYKCCADYDFGCVKEYAAALIQEYFLTSEFAE